MAATALIETNNNGDVGKFACDKAHIEQVHAVINYLERKKIKHNLFSMPVKDNDTVQMVHGIIFNNDKKNTRKNKKMISYNKYILFNSWYTKNRQETWPNSHTMWNIMKSQPVAKPFVDIFDFMEKLGKTIASNASDSADEQNVEKDDSASRSDVEEGNEKRSKIYNEFYRITSVTFETHSAPFSSFIYDIKLKKSHNGTERLTRSMLQSGIDALRKCLLHVSRPSKTEVIEQQQHSEENKASRKRKQSNAVVVNKNPKKSKQRYEPPAFSMQNDHIEDSQMSFT
ncbi:39K [Helicoverpa armigera multiple nucleopolyhedrovirus]|uniref:Pp31 n=1 Tax=Mamestra brassicae nuclear polyhedrosis virus TaxID=78219 RepID=A0A077D338_NPVMB|nr:39K [Helicoverpa armigera multiple nucleopolyhedrovirus]AIL25222.1 pp31 [Mamestra brassicae multiple nucleopolyhedrovirus]